MGRVTTRFAPSPTGDLHIGNARTALFNLLLASHTGGSFVLRIEDTDTERSEASHEKTIMEDLGWLGIEWDEGPDKGGPRGPYRQSERLGVYAEHAKRLVDKGLAYRCFCSKERLASLKAEQIRKGTPPRYDNRCRGLHDAGSTPPSGEPPVLRFVVPGRAVRFDDGVHGPMGFETSAMGDFVIMGSDSIPSYNFAVVVDDALMEITHVMRGDDHLSNTPRQIMLCDALGFTAPAYYHLPLVLSADKVPLSKRDSASSVRSIREEGFLPEAVVNTMAHLGWNAPIDSALTLDEMAEAFDGKKLSKSPSVFDLDRLKSYNKEAIGAAGSERLIGLAGLKQTPEATKAADVIKASAATITEFRELIAPFVEDEARPDEEAGGVLASPDARAVLASLWSSVKAAGDIDDEAYDRIISEVKAATGAKGRALFMPIRAALTGHTTGIELTNILKLLGRERIIARLEKFIK